MAAIGVILLWSSYWSGLSGVSMVKGWNNSPWGLANPFKVATFTTACYTGSGVFPTGRSADSGKCGGGGGGRPPRQIARSIFANPKGVGPNRTGVAR